MMGLSFNIDDVITNARRIFIAKLPERIHKLESALQNDDRRAMANSLHELRGAAVHFEGFEGLIETSEQLEHDIKQGKDVATMRSHFGLLKNTARKYMHS